MTTNIAPQNPASGVVALTLRDVMRKTAMGRSSVYKMIRNGDFPSPAKVGRRAIFSSEEVDTWLRARFAERDGGAR